MNGTGFIWDAAGRPSPPPSAGVADEAGMCAMCGADAPRTGPAARALGKNFSDPYLFARLDGSDRVCEACAWCVAGKPPATLRMWSVVVRSDAPPSADKAWLQVPGLCLTNRGNPRPVTDTLTSPPDGPWLVSIAESGQKHVAPFARVNDGRGRWTVRMETVDITSTPDEFAVVLGAAATLRAAGHSAAAVTNGVPTMTALRSAADLAWWRTHADQLASVTRSPLLALALWALTKETTNDHARPRTDTSGPDGPDGGVG